MLGYPQSGWGELDGRQPRLPLLRLPLEYPYVLLPEERFDGFKGGPPESLPRSPGHHREWVEACQGNGKTFSPFEVGGPLTELLQLANLATLVEGPLEFDVAGGRILNSDQAEALLHREYRAGWALWSDA
jgi:hypothetical protein